MKSSCVCLWQALGCCWNTPQWYSEFTVPWEASSAYPVCLTLTEPSSVRAPELHLLGNVDKPSDKDTVCTSKSQSGQGITVLSDDLGWSTSVSGTWYPEGNAALEKEHQEKLKVRKSNETVKIYSLIRETSVTLWSLQKTLVFVIHLC